MEQLDLDECLATAERVAREAGDLISKAFYGSKHVDKKGTADYVTETDRAVEKHIFTQLRAKYPTHAFIGEEGVSGEASLGERPSATAPTWVVDPIDGTTNFVHCYPQVCVSVALVAPPGTEPVVGVVHCPLLGETFTAARGRGAFLNGQRISVSASRSLLDAVVATNVGAGPARQERHIEFVTSNVARLVRAQALAIRMTGSAAISMAYVACGRFCAFYEWGIHVWDFSAGVVLVKEAGGVVLDPSGGPHDLASQRVLAGNPSVAPEVAKVLLPKDF
eukprot:m51a1_g5861 putative inositol-phosphate phosphatase (278) ;mRNA; r:384185-385397